MRALAEEVAERFAGFDIGSGKYLVELLAPTAPPEAPSTGGGRPALQHIRLRPQREGFSVVVAGSVNLIEKHGELRTFEHAFLVHELRSGKALDISVAHWEQLLRKLEEVLHLANIETARVGPSPNLLRDAREKKESRRISPRALVLFLVVLVLAGAVAARVVQILAR